MENTDLSKRRIISTHNKTLVITFGEEYLDQSKEGFFVLDFSFKFDNPDLNVFPTGFIPVNSKQDKYIVKKFNVILGEVKND